MPINHLLWLYIWKNEKKVFKIIEKIILNGFQSIKIKISKSIFDYLIIILKKIEKKYPFIQIRLDANGCFLNLKETFSFIKKIGKIKLINYLEQPILPGNWKDMAYICKNSNIPIALDEELYGIFNLDKKKRLLDFIKPNFLVIKPTTVGGFHESEEWIIEASKRKIKWCISSSLESNIGINIISQWTFIMNKKYKKYSSFFHGLDIKNIYNNDYFPSLNVKNGCLWYHNKFFLKKNWNFEDFMKIF